VCHCWYTLLFLVFVSPQLHVAPPSFGNSSFSICLASYLKLFLFYLLYWWHSLTPAMMDNNSLLLNKLHPAVPMPLAKFNDFPQLPLTYKTCTETHSFMTIFIILLATAGRNEKSHWDSMKYPQARNGKSHWDSMKYPQARNEKLHWEGMKYPQARNETLHWDSMKYPQARNEKLHWDSMKYPQARNEKLHWEGMKYPQARNENLHWEGMKYSQARNEQSHWEGMKYPQARNVKLHWDSMKYPAGRNKKSLGQYEITLSR